MADKDTKSPTDMVAAIAVQNLIHETWGNKLRPMPELPDHEIENPTKWVAMEDVQIICSGSGAMLVRKGQIIDSAKMAHAIQEKGADIRPIE